MYSMQRFEERQARDLIGEFLERGMVPDEIVADVSNLVDDGDALRALELILRTREDSR